MNRYANEGLNNDARDAYSDDVVYYYVMDDTYNPTQEDMDDAVKHLVSQVPEEEEWIIRWFLN